MDNKNGQGQNQDGSTIDQQIREREDAAFEADLKAVQAKHKRVIVPIIESSKFGIYPSMRSVTEPEYLNIMNKLGFQPVGTDKPETEPKG